MNPHSTPHSPLTWTPSRPPSPASPSLPTCTAPLICTHYRAVRLVCRDWLFGANQCVASLAPLELRVDRLVASFPLLRSLDLSACVQVRGVARQGGRAGELRAGVWVRGGVGGDLR